MDENKKTCDCGCNHEEEIKNCDCGHENCDCGNDEFDEEIVELTTDDGRKIKFFHLGTIDYKEKFYAAFQPAEEIEGIDEEEMVIFEVAMVDDSCEESELLPIEDQKLLDSVYDEFCKRLSGEGDEDADCHEEHCDCHKD